MRAACRVPFWLLIVGHRPERAGSSIEREALHALSMGSPKGHYSAEKALEIARILLPDILSYDYSSAAGYLNLNACRTM